MRQMILNYNIAKCTNEYQFLSKWQVTFRPCIFENWMCLVLSAVSSPCPMWIRLNGIDVRYLNSVRRETEPGTHCRIATIFTERENSIWRTRAPQFRCKIRVLNCILFVRPVYSTVWNTVPGAWTRAQCGNPHIIKSWWASECKMAKHDMGNAYFHWLSSARYFASFRRFEPNCRARSLECCLQFSIYLICKLKLWFGKGNNII